MSPIMDSDDDMLEVCLTVRMMRSERAAQGAGIWAPGEVPYGEYFYGRTQAK